MNLRNPINRQSDRRRLSAIEAELTEHTRALVQLDMYLLLLETALLTAKVFDKEGLDALRNEVLKKHPKKEEKKIITL